MATHYETLDIDTDASPEESELPLLILGLRSLGHRPPPALPSPVLAFGLAPYLETDIHTPSPVRKAYKKAIFRLHPNRRRKQMSHAQPNALDFDDPQLLLQASLHGTGAVIKYTPPPPEPVDPTLEKALLARFERIQAAYDTLSVPEKRQAYDKVMLADEEMSLFGERKAQREARRDVGRHVHRPTHHLPPPVPESQTNIKPPFVWDVDRKQPLFWDPNPQPNYAPPSGEADMQLIRKEDAAVSSKYIFTREAAVKRLGEINDENYGGFKFIKGVSLGAVELQSKDLVPVRRPVHRRHDSADTLVAPEPAPTLPPKVAMEIPEPPKKTDIRRESQIYKLAHAMTTADLYHARLKLEREQALLAQIESVKAHEESHRLRVERERQRVQLDMQRRMAVLEKERERIRAEEEYEKLRAEQAKLAAAAAQLSSQMQAWPRKVNEARRPHRPRVSSDVGRRKEDTWPKKEVANEWGGWDAGNWRNVEPTPTGVDADAGWGTTWNGNWENPNYHQPPQQNHENWKSRAKELNTNNAWADGWGAQPPPLLLPPLLPPPKDMMETGQRSRSRSRSKSFSVGQSETKQRARSRERADYWEQTKPEPEEKAQPRKLTKPAKVRFDMVDVPEQLRPYERSDGPKGTLSGGFKRLFGRA
jgi:curved DNA-binding protein CbpA